MVIRTESESSEFSELEEAGVEPLSLDDICFNESYASITRYAFILIKRLIIMFNAGMMLLNRIMIQQLEVDSLQLLLKLWWRVRRRRSCHLARRTGWRQSISSKTEEIPGRSFTLRTSDLREEWDTDTIPWHSPGSWMSVFSSSTTNLLLMAPWENATECKN